MLLTTTASSLATQSTAVEAVKPLALDLTNQGWTFEKSSRREEARRLMNEHAPMLVLLSSAPDPDNYSLQFAKWQYRVGRGFIEHSDGAGDQAPMETLTQLPGVVTVAYQNGS